MQYQAGDLGRCGCTCVCACVLCVWMRACVGARASVCACVSASVLACHLNLRKRAVVGLVDHQHHLENLLVLLRVRVEREHLRV
jgi:hypothetical protein